MCRPCCGVGGQCLRYRGGCWGGERCAPHRPGSCGLLRADHARRLRRGESPSSKAARATFGLKGSCSFPTAGNSCRTRRSRRYEVPAPLAALGPKAPMLAGDGPRSPTPRRSGLLARCGQSRLAVQGWRSGRHSAGLVSPGRRGGATRRRCGRCASRAARGDGNRRRETCRTGLLWTRGLPHCR